MFDEKINQVIGDLIDVDSGTYILTNKKVPLISSIIENNKIYFDYGINAGKYIPFENIFLKECNIDNKKYYLYYLTINPSNCEIIDFRNNNYDRMDNKIFEMFYNYLMAVCNQDTNVLLFASWSIEEYIRKLEMQGFEGYEYKYVDLDKLDWEYTLISIYPDEKEKYLFRKNE